MQNKFLRFVLCLGCVVFVAHGTQAQDLDDFAPELSEPVMTEDVVTPDLTGKQAVDFPARTSLDSLELAPLPGIYETDVKGPQPLGTSVSPKDMPSERLIGLLTPEVFKEMAELERDNTFLKLQIQKENMKNDLEKVRANYRQARLDEIAKREDVVRTRIQWWQEQEKIRQDLEAQRAAAEAAKAEDEKIPEAAEEETEKADTEAEEVAPAKPAQKVYLLIDIFGTRGTLSARVKNIESGRISTVQAGDMLTDGSQVEEISPAQVILIKEDVKTTLDFDDV